jgi:hypothetical protein
MTQIKFNPENTVLWDRLFETPPSQTKGFKRAGGFSGTAIKPYWVIRRATEEFGPIGKGWGWTEEENKTYTHIDGQAIWMSKIVVWWRDGDQVHQIGPQWGQTMMVVKRLSGDVFIDEEAPKKAVTDGVVKCLSYLGLGGDVHMGLFDDSKYVAEAKVEERKASDRKQATRDKKGPDRDATGNGGEPPPPGADGDAEGKSEGSGDQEPEKFNPANWRDRICADAKLLKTEKAVRSFWATTVKPTVDQLMASGDPAMEKIATYVHGEVKKRLNNVRGGTSEAAE